MACKFCTWNENEQDKFFGETSKKFTMGFSEGTIGNSIYINPNDYDTEEQPFMQAVGNFFDFSIDSKKIKIKYCPFCGRKFKGVK